MCASAWRSCSTKREEVESAKDAFGARGLASPGPLLDAFSCTSDLFALEVQEYVWIFLEDDFWYVSRIQFSLV